MPRHTVGSRNSAAQKTTDTSAPPAMPGGAAGMPDPTGAMPMAPNNPYADTQAMQGRAEVKAKEWMIVDGPRADNGKVRFNDESGLVLLSAGKIVTESSHDLVRMRSQGIKLEAMPEEIEVPADEPEVEAAAQDATA